MSYCLQEGDVFELLPKHSKNVICKNGFIPGKYVVDNAGYYGGGTGHGPHDVYPDGWYITGILLSDQTKKVYFWQTGCFNKMLPDIIPIGKAEKIWTEMVNIQ